MKILLDTNIIIHREASRVINEDIGTLFNWFDRLKYTKCIHPLTHEELMTHSDPVVRETMRIKIGNYNTLKTIAPDTDEIREIREDDNSRNDEIDTSIVNELANDRVNIIISEDKGVHRKAKRLGLDQRVFKIDQFLETVVAQYPELKGYQVLSVRKEYFGNIDVSQSFFESFREDYPGFDKWFKKKSDEVAYVCYEDDEIKAFLYIKVENEDENYSDIQPVFPEKKRLKIGTLKVVSTGFKLGERFIKIISDNALQYNVDEIYVTLFDRTDPQRRLIQLLEEWGFLHYGVKNESELVYSKKFTDVVPDLANPRLTYPFVTRNSRKFIVPIYPQYHTELFPDSILNNESPNDFVENEPYRNAIKKVYISRSYEKSLDPGDLIVFYRTGGYHRGVVSTLGVVESVIKNIPDFNTFKRLARRRSVFSDAGLDEYWNYNKYNRPFIVNFLYINSFPKPKVNLIKLTKSGIIAKAPRGFELLDDGAFNYLVEIARIDESCVSN
ncbi:hypothetical protein CEQ90_19250 [Lewinellaceae bacterium SD302]|nr:hypothetical protein CEQ90_19250 [Lewinellaceae bacterium SD302]